MQVFVGLENGNVSALSTFQTEGADIEVELSEAIDLEKLRGYRIEGRSGTNYLVYDGDLYQKLQDDQATAEKIRQEEVLLAELTRALALKQATDEQAMSLIHQYPEWSGSGKDYKPDDRVQYNGKLYKVLQGHTSQTDWTPDAAVSLFSQIQ